MISQTRQSRPEDTHEPQRSRSPAKASETVDSYESLLSAEQSSVLEEEGDVDLLRRAAQEMAAVTEKVDSLGATLAKLADEVQRIKTDDHVLTEMHDRCRDLSEGLYERELVRPIVMGLIGVADRCRQQEDQAEVAMRQAKAGGKKLSELAIRHVLNCRQADRAEIESLLASLSLEAFREPGQAFSPATQRCIQFVPCKPSEHEGAIARRLQPGYRRYGKVIRHELVSIVSNKANVTPRGGGS